MLPTIQEEPQRLLQLSAQCNFSGQTIWHCLAIQEADRRINSITLLQVGPTCQLPKLSCQVHQPQHTGMMTQQPYFAARLFHLDASCSLVI